MGSPINTRNPGMMEGYYLLKSTSRPLNKIMYDDVPTKGRRTFFTEAGQIFAWLCVAGFLVLVMFSIKGPAKTSLKDEKDTRYGFNN
jgi:hypothetical protein